MKLQKLATDGQVWGVKEVAGAAPAASSPVGGGTRAEEDVGHDSMSRRILSAVQPPQVLPQGIKTSRKLNHVPNFPE